MAPSTPEPRALRVTSAWNATYVPALVVRAGDSVTPGRMDDDYPGWQWVTNASGLGGWIPASLLEGGRVASDFDTAELTVHPGMTVTSLKTRAGWHWCRDHAGNEGWLPASHLAPT